MNLKTNSEVKSENDELRTVDEPIMDTLDTLDTNHSQTQIQNIVSLDSPISYEQAIDYSLTNSNHIMNEKNELNTKDLNNNENIENNEINENKENREKNGKSIEQLKNEQVERAQNAQLNSEISSQFAVSFPKLTLDPVFSSPSNMIVSPTTLNQTFDDEASIYDDTIPNAVPSQSPKFSNTQYNKFSKYKPSQLQDVEEISSIESTSMNHDREYNQNKTNQSLHDNNNTNSNSTNSIDTINNINNNTNNNTDSFNSSTSNNVLQKLNYKNQHLDLSSSVSTNISTEVNKNFHESSMHESSMQSMYSNYSTQELTSQSDNSKMVAHTEKKKSKSFPLSRRHVRSCFEFFTCCFFKINLFKCFEPRYLLQKLILIIKIKDAPHKHPRYYGMEPPYDLLQVVAWILFCLNAITFVIFCLLPLHHWVSFPIGLIYIFMCLIWFTTNTILGISNPRDHRSCMKGTRKDFNLPRNKGLVWCQYCSAFVHTSSKHCKLCDKCVETFDHHCRWLNTCIGKKNYPIFFIFLTTTLLILLYQVIVTVYYIIAFIIEYESFGFRIQVLFGGSDRDEMAAQAIQASVGVLASIFRILLFVFQMIASILVCIAIIPVANLWILHIKLNIRRQTTYEYIITNRQLKEEFENAIKKGIFNPGPQGRKKRVLSICFKGCWDIYESYRWRKFLNWRKKQEKLKYHQQQKEDIHSKKLDEKNQKINQKINIDPKETNGKVISIDILDQRNGNDSKSDTKLNTDIDKRQSSIHSNSTSVQNFIPLLKLPLEKITPKLDSNQRSTSARQLKNRILPFDSNAASYIISAKDPLDSLHSIESGYEPRRNDTKTHKNSFRIRRSEDYSATIEIYDIPNLKSSEPQLNKSEPTLEAVQSGNIKQSLDSNLLISSVETKQELSPQKINISKSNDISRSSVSRNLFPDMLQHEIYTSNLNPDKVSLNQSNLSISNESIVTNISYQTENIIKSSNQINTNKSSGIINIITTSPKKPTKTEERKSARGNSRSSIQFNQDFFGKLLQSEQDKTHNSREVRNSNNFKSPNEEYSRLQISVPHNEESQYSFGDNKNSYDFSSTVRSEKRKSADILSARRSSAFSALCIADEHEFNRDVQNNWKSLNSKDINQLDFNHNNSPPISSQLDSPAEALSAVSLHFLEDQFSSLP